MQHLDDAHGCAESFLTEWIKKKPGRWRILVVKDVLAMIRIVLWCPRKEWASSSNEIDHGLRNTSAEFWSGRVIQGQDRSHPDGAWQDAAWQQAALHESTKKLRILGRHLTKSGWFEAPAEPPWKLRTEHEPAIVLFYSFKGGVGRSTALAATASHLASNGDRVVVLDADLDAPGVASMLAGHGGATAPWGIVDYLLERRVRGNAEPHIEDYYHQYAEAGVSGAEIFVYPAGTLNRAYVDKLARIDYGSEADGSAHPFVALLGQIRRELAPRWILIDAGAGFGEIAGFLTGGLCHLYVLLGTPADASWRGLELMLERLGGSRIREGKPQAECLLVASMVPRSDESLFKQLVQRFTDRARDAFSAHYYAAPQEALDTASTPNDPKSDDAPHVPVAVPYDERLATFRDFREVAEPIMLSGDSYTELARRIRIRAS